jgi:hypothetical protein
MLRRVLWLPLAAVLGTSLGQSTTSTANSESTTSLTSSLSLSTSLAVTSGGDVPIGSLATYLSPTSTILFTSNATSTRASGSSNGTTSSTSLSSIGGTRTSNVTATSTYTSAGPVNTQPCNGYPEFCTRSYSNITMVTSHNFPFTGQSFAANQQYDVTTQLNDGIRMCRWCRSIHTL